MILNIPDYDGPCVYILKDEQGRVYVGSADNLHVRIRELQSKLQCGKAVSKLQEACDSGVNFTAYIIRKFSTNIPRNVVRDFKVQVINDFKSKGTLYYNSNRVHEEDAPFRAPKPRKVYKDYNKHYNKRYNLEHYDTISVSLPKGTKELLQACADASGCSLHRFVVKLLSECAENNLA